MKKVGLLALIIAAYCLKADPSYAQCATPPTNTGTVTLSADVTAGDYRIWARMKAADSTNNSFYLRVSSNCPILVGDSSQISSSEWTWVDYNGGNPSSKNSINLNNSTRVITLIGNEPGVSVDKILLTKNLSCIPTGFGDNCPAEIPISVPPTTLTNSPSPAAGQIALDSHQITVSNYLPIKAENGTEKRIMTITSKFDQSVSFVGYPTSYGPGINFIPTSTFLKKDVPTDIIIEIRPTVPPGKYSGKTSLYTTYDQRTVSLPEITIEVSGTSSPTSTPPTFTPTPSPKPNDTVLKFSTIKLHGIGNGGDNTNPTIQGNMNPITKTRSFTVELYDAAGSLATTATGSIVYDASKGVFSGDIIANSSLQNTNYLLKVKTDKYIKRPMNRIITLNLNSTNEMPEVALIAGDINNDSKLTIDDYNLLMDCYSDLAPARNCEEDSKKAGSDITDDGKVNLNDYNFFLREISVISGD
jgi:hypothetical protein